MLKIKIKIVGTSLSMFLSLFTKKAVVCDTLNLCIF